MTAEDIENQTKQMSAVDINNLEMEIFEELECYIASINGFYSLEDDIQKVIVNAYIQGYTTKALKN